MTQTEPTYFTEFKKELFGMLKVKFKKVDERFDTQERQIADLSVKTSKIEKETEGLKESVKRINNRLDQHTDTFMIGIKTLDNHNTRITKLEKELA